MEKSSLVDYFKEKALALGFDDSRLAALPDGSAVLLLFCAYGLEQGKTEHGRIPLSNYYPAAQKGYLLAKKMEKAAQEHGFSARTYKKHGLKQIALSAGGQVGKNTLYRHPRLGTYVSIQALPLPIELSAAAPAEENSCKDCTACADACPTGAIGKSGFHKEKCLRFHTNKAEIPEEYGSLIYQLMGCERCQSACPKNPQRYEEAHSYDIIEVLKGLHTPSLKKLIGTNYGTRTRIFNQTLFYAANTGYRAALPQITSLIDDELCGAAARYAYKKLTEG